eukprot:TRINITY_DN4419_c0_g1_i2.p1 TRINITY_DN4419_c0_g1~~TRINITY_DN4419_c0_g1_i2.p1  ORF type:complete len:293 (-),score=43.49 TRINITY_DN4419_c0_g1_i2:16-894(-)
MYSKERGYLFLKRDLWEKHNITHEDITIMSDDVCLGSFFEKFIHNIIGYTTPILNDIFSVANGTGYIYDVAENEFYDLESQFPVHDLVDTGFEYVAFKIIILGEIILNIYCCVSLISFVIVETLNFTLSTLRDLRNVRVFSIRNLFRLIMLNLGTIACVWGILSDITIGFIFTMLIWSCKMFLIMHGRSKYTWHFFPRMFTVCGLACFMYINLYPLGYHYLGMLVYSSMILYSMLYSIHKFELVALRTQNVTLANPRQLPPRRRRGMRWPNTQPNNEQTMPEIQETINIEMD